MLKAAIIYLQGSGGNLVARSLSLDPATVAYLPKDLANVQPTYGIGTDDRLALYNNWDSTNWTKSESSLGMWYQHGLSDFVELETSPLQLIGQFHPVQFKTETELGILWEKISAWEHLVFIRYNPKSFDRIAHLARVKRKDLNHTDQLPAEVKTHKQLLHLNGVDIWWEDMLELDSYIAAIQQLGNQIGVTIHVDPVRILWQNWAKHTQQL